MYYVGATEDCENRLTRHNSGYVKSTKAHLPWVKVYQEEFVSRPEALARELEIKKWKSRRRIEKLINMAPSSSGSGQ